MMASVFSSKRKREERKVKEQESCVTHERKERCT